MLLIFVNLCGGKSEEYDVCDVRMGNLRNMIIIIATVDSWEIINLQISFQSTVIR